MKKYGCPDCGKDVLIAQKWVVLVEFIEDDECEYTTTKGIIRKKSAWDRAYNFDEKSYKCGDCGCEFDLPKQWVTNREEASK